MLASLSQEHVASFLGKLQERAPENDKGKALILLDRCVFPVLNFRVSRWPPQQVIADELDQTQAKMIASILRYRPGPGEDIASFCRRRMRDARSIADAQGTWSGKWFDRFERWNEHLHRHLDHNCTRLLSLMNAQWLRERRARYAPANPIRWNAWSCHAGRTNTRIGSGYIAQRWESGRDFGNRQVTSH